MHIQARMDDLVQQKNRINQKWQVLGIVKKKKKKSISLSLVLSLLF